MPPLSPDAILIAEFAIAALVFALWWGCLCLLLYRRHRLQREALEAHLEQLETAANQLRQTSVKLADEVERLFADCEEDAADGSRLDRLEWIRQLLNQQRDAVEKSLAEPLEPDTLMERALPAFRLATRNYEESVLTILRQWDAALDDVEAQLSVSYAQRYGSAAAVEDYADAPVAEAPVVDTAALEAGAQRVAELEEQVDTLKAQSIAAGNEAEAMRSQAGSLKTERDRLAQTSQQADARIRQLELELRDARAAARELANAPQSVAQDDSEELAAYKAKYGEMADQLKDLREEIERAAIDVELLSESNERKEEEMARMKPFVETLEQHNQAQEDELKRQTQSTRELRSALERMTAEKEGLERQLERLRRQVGRGEG